MTFYDRVKELCSKQGKSITAVALDLGMSRSVPYNWKNGTAPQSGTVQKVASYFNMTPAELLNFDGGMLIQTVQDNHGIIGQQITAPTTLAQLDEQSEKEPTLTDLEAELVRLFRKLPIMEQAQLLVSLNAKIEKGND